MPSPLDAPTATLADFVTRADPAAVPHTVRHEATRSLVNVLGCALGGARDAATRLLWSALQPCAGAPAATLLVTGERTDALTAALVNGYASNILDFDDTHLATVIHPGPPVFSALLALAEWLQASTVAGAGGAGLPPAPARSPVSGDDLLHAFLLGMEVACRTGVAIGPGHYARGWHITGTCGVLGAAAGAARLLRLDAARTTAALGIAATQAGGLSEMMGGMCKTFNIARAGREGLAAALLAARGFTSSQRALEAPRGFAHVLADGLDREALVGELGERWEAGRNTYKPYPCGIVLHPLIDACLDLVQAHDLQPAQIAAVDLQVHPLVLKLTWRTDPQDGLASKLSYTHAAAVALVQRDAGVAQFSDECARNTQVVAMRSRIRAVEDASLASDQVQATIRMNDGRQFSTRVEHACGSLDNPLGDDALSRKFRALADPALGAQQAQRALDLAWGVATLPAAGELARACAATAMA